MRPGTQPHLASRATGNHAAWEAGLLRTSASTEISPFDFSRTIELVGSEVRLQCQLTNRSATKENFLWALHPLLRLQTGDRLEVPPATRASLNGEPWLDNINVSSAGECAKVFAAPVAEGFAAISNRATGDRLEFEWSPAENNVLGVWLTRGGWHGHEHFALEPTNSDADTLSSAAARGRCGTLAGGQTISSRVCLRLGA